MADDDFGAAAGISKTGPYAAKAGWLGAPTADEAAAILRGFPSTGEFTAEKEAETGEDGKPTPAAVRARFWRLRAYADAVRSADPQAMDKHMAGALYESAAKEIFDVKDPDGRLLFGDDHKTDDGRTLLARLQEHLPFGPVRIPKSAELEAFDKMPEDEKYRFAMANEPLRRKLQDDISGARGGSVSAGFFKSLFWAFTEAGVRQQEAAATLSGGKIPGTTEMRGVVNKKIDESIEEFKKGWDESNLTPEELAKKKARVIAQYRQQLLMRSRAYALAEALAMASDDTKKIVRTAIELGELPQERYEAIPEGERDLALAAVALGRGYADTGHLLGIPLDISGAPSFWRSVKLSALEAQGGFIEAFKGVKDLAAGVKDLVWTPVETGYRYLAGINDEAERRRQYELEADRRRVEMAFRRPYQAAGGVLEEASRVTCAMTAFFVADYLMGKVGKTLFVKGAKLVKTGLQGKRAADKLGRGALYLVKAGEKAAELEKRLPPGGAFSGYGGFSGVLTSEGANVMATSLSLARGCETAVRSGAFKMIEGGAVYTAGALMFAAPFAREYTDSVVAAGGTPADAAKAVLVVSLANAMIEKLQLEGMTGGTLRKASRIINESLARTVEGSVGRRLFKAAAKATGHVVWQGVKTGFGEFVEESGQGLNNDIGTRLVLDFKKDGIWSAKVLKSLIPTEAMVRDAIGVASQGIVAYGTFAVLAPVGAHVRRSFAAYGTPYTGAAVEVSDRLNYFRSVIDGFYTGNWNDGGSAEGEAAGDGTLPMPTPVEEGGADGGTLPMPPPEGGAEAEGGVVVSEAGPVPDESVEGGGVLKRKPKTGAPGERSAAADIAAKRQELIGKASRIIDEHKHGDHVGILMREANVPEFVAASAVSFAMEERALSGAALWEFVRSSPEEGGLNYADFSERRIRGTVPGYAGGYEMDERTGDIVFRLEFDVKDKAGNVTKVPWRVAVWRLHGPVYTPATVPAETVADNSNAGASYDASRSPEAPSWAELSEGRRREIVAGSMNGKYEAAAEGTPTFVEINGKRCQVDAIISLTEYGNLSPFNQDISLSHELAHAVMDIARAGGALADEDLRAYAEENGIDTSSGSWKTQAEDMLANNFADYTLGVHVPYKSEAGLFGRLRDLAVYVNEKVLGRKTERWHNQGFRFAPYYEGVMRGRIGPAQLGVAVGPVAPGEAEGGQAAAPVIAAAAPEGEEPPPEEGEGGSGEQPAVAEEQQPEAAEEEQQPEAAAEEQPAVAEEQQPEVAAEEQRPEAAAPAPQPGPKSRESLRGEFLESMPQDRRDGVKKVLKSWIGGHRRDGKYISGFDFIENAVSLGSILVDDGGATYLMTEGEDPVRLMKDEAEYAKFLGIGTESQAKIKGEPAAPVQVQAEEKAGEETPAPAPAREEVAEAVAAAEEDPARAAEAVKDAADAAVSAPAGQEAPAAARAFVDRMNGGGGRAAAPEEARPSPTVWRADGKSGMRAEGEVRIVEADDIVSPYDNSPDYDPRLPRLSAPAKAAAPAGAAAAATDGAVGEGAPVVAPLNNNVIAGAETLRGIAAAYESGGGEYRRAVEEAAAALGVDVSGMRRPVVVRAVTKIDSGTVYEFAKAENPEPPPEAPRNAPPSPRRLTAAEAEYVLGGAPEPGRSRRFFSDAGWTRYRGDMAAWKEGAAAARETGKPAPEKPDPYRDNLKYGFNRAAFDKARAEWESNADRLKRGVIDERLKKDWGDVEMDIASKGGARRLTKKQKAALRAELESAGAVISGFKTLPGRAASVTLSGPAGVSKVVIGTDGNVERSQEAAKYSMDDGGQYAEVESSLRGTSEWMRAPNGKPTMLTERQWVQVRTPNFKAWFGDWENDPANASKVVDENGEPRVMYHHTVAEFTVFRRGERGGKLGNGIYFSYVPKKSFGPHRIAAFLNLRNPLTRQNAPEGAVSMLGLKPGTMEAHPEFDGTMLFANEVTVNEPSQIKSADENTGAFDSSSPDIRYSMGGGDVQEAGEFSDAGVRYSIGSREQALASFSKARRDLSAEECESRISILFEAAAGPLPGGVNENKFKTVVYHWMVRGDTKLPEDRPAVDAAFRVSRNKRVDPGAYKTPQELVNAFRDVSAKEGASLLDPDKVPEFKGKEDRGNGVTVYTVDDTQDGQRAVRDVFNNNYGKDFDCWCLVHGNGHGGLSTDAWGYWQRYNRVPKKIAFQDGRVVAFQADDTGEGIWWDLTDSPHYWLEDITDGHMWDERGNVKKDFTGVIRKRQAGTGRILKEESYKNGKRDGWGREWWAYDGSLSAECFYKDGKPVGLSRDYWRDGTLRAERSYNKNGQPDGLWRVWEFQGGPLFLEENYKNGVKDGLSRRWWDNGRLSSETTYKNDVLDGRSRRWDEDGQLIYDAVFENGVEVSVAVGDAGWYSRHSIEEEGGYFRYSIIGQAGAERAAEGGRKEWLARLEEAKGMYDDKKNKKSMAYIRRKTGWELGADGNWKMFLPTLTGSFFTRPEATVESKENSKEKYLTVFLKPLFDAALAEDEGRRWTLKDVLLDDPVFEAYPDLAKVKVGIIRWPDPGARAGYSEKAGIVLGNEYLNSFKEMGSYDEQVKSFLDTLMHEVQHWIQDHEGWPRGAAPEEFKKFIKDASKSEEALAAAAQSPLGKTIGWDKHGPKLSDLNTREKRNWVAFDIYRRFAGEVEARAAGATSYQGEIRSLLERILSKDVKPSQMVYVVGNKYGEPRPSGAKPAEAKYSMATLSDVVKWEAAVQARAAAASLARTGRTEMSDGERKILADKYRRFFPWLDGSGAEGFAAGVAEEAEALARETRGRVRGATDEKLMMELSLAQTRRYAASLRKAGMGAFNEGGKTERAKEKAARRKRRALACAVAAVTGLAADDIETYLGVDLTETLLSLPAAYRAEREAAAAKAAKVAEAGEQPAAEKEEAPEKPGPRMATAEETKQMRDLIEDLSRLSREKAERDRAAAEERRRKREESAAARGESAPAEEEGEDGEDAEEESPVTGPGGIAAAIAEKKAVDLEDPAQFARFVELLSAEIWRREHPEEAARDAYGLPWANPLAYQYLRTTAQAVYRKLARALTYGRSRSAAEAATARMRNCPTPTSLLRQMEIAGGIIQKQMIKETREQLIRRIEKKLVEKFGAGGRPAVRKDALDRKVSAATEAFAREVKRVLRLSERMAAKKMDEAVAAASGAREEFESEGRKVEESLTYSEAMRRIAALNEFGALIRRTPGEIVDAEARLDEILANEDTLERFKQREEGFAKTAGALAAAFQNDRDMTGRRGPAVILGNALLDHLDFKHTLIDMMRLCRDPAVYKAAREVIDAMQDELQVAADRTATEVREQAAEMKAAVERIYGERYDKVLRELQKEDPAFAEFGLRGIAGGRVAMSRGQAMQLYASLCQAQYARNARANGREGQRARLEELLTEQDMALIAWLRDWYARNRQALSDVTMDIIGTPILAESANYMPVKLLMPRKGPERIAAHLFQPFPPELSRRVSNTHDFDVSKDIVSVWAEKMASQAQWKHHAALGVALRGIFGNEWLQAVVGKCHGEYAVTHINQFITDILCGSHYDDAAGQMRGSLDVIRGWCALSALSGNVGVMVKQTTSIPAFAFELGVRDTLRHFFTAFSPEGIDAMLLIWRSDQRKNRWDSGNSEAVINALRDRDSSAIRRLFAAGMITNKAGDIVPSLVIGQGIYRGLIAQGFSGEAAMNRTWELINRTQQTGQMDNLSTLQRRSAWGRMLFQFQSTQRQYIAYELVAIRAFMAGRPGSGKNLTKVLLLNHVILPAAYLAAGGLFTSLLGAPPPEDRLLKYAIAMLMGPYSSLFVFGFMAQTALAYAFTGHMDLRTSMLPAADYLRREVTDAARLLRTAALLPTDRADFMDLVDASVKFMEDTSPLIRDVATAVENRILDDGKD